MNNDLISREDLKKYKFTTQISKQISNRVELEDIEVVPVSVIDNAPTVEEKNEPLFITECRDTAIEENLPLYFVYYEETGVFEVYVTKTKELFEKRHCSKHLPNYKFREIATDYLDWYLDWKGGVE